MVGVLRRGIAGGGPGWGSVGVVSMWGSLKAHNKIRGVKVSGGGLQGGGPCGRLPGVAVMAWGCWGCPPSDAPPPKPLQVLSQLQVRGEQDDTVGSEHRYVSPITCTLKPLGTP